MEETKKIEKLMAVISLQSYGDLIAILKNLEEELDESISKISIDLIRNESGDSLTYTIESNENLRTHSRFFTRPINKTIPVVKSISSDTVNGSEAIFKAGTLKKIPEIKKLLDEGAPLNHIMNMTSSSKATIKKIITVYGIDYKEDPLYFKDGSSNPEPNLFQEDEEKKTESPEIDMDLETEIIEDLINFKNVFEIAMSRGVPSLEVERIADTHKEFIEKNQSAKNSKKPKTKEEQGRMLDDHINMASKGLIV